MLLWWCSKQLLVVLVLLAAVRGTSGSWPFKNERCNYTSKIACTAAAGGRACVWCNGRGCQPVGQAGSNLVDVCASAPRRRPSEAVECEDIASVDKCNLLDRCTWCTSSVVDDGCFGFVEARRLPWQVFDCTGRTSLQSGKQQNDL